jgi:hypothetical protein
VHPTSSIPRCPGASFGGILLIVATGRHVALFGALLAAVAGAWFTLGTTLSPLWNNHVIPRAFCFRPLP